MSLRTQKRVIGASLGDVLVAVHLSNGCLTLYVCSGEMYAASIAEYEWPNGSYWLKRRAATLPESGH